ncbi:ATPase [Bacteroidetes bacterium UKL13-3]|nr:ATPase [Bacteroidetes bacterium UKL13-3]HCP94192.1 ATPase [Bacteroidota bacterium]
MSNLNQYDFDHLRNLTIGTVDYVSPSEIKVILDITAPQNTALNTGTPTLFPRINGFVLIPNENGALVGLISWLGVEHSQYPKRKGYKDFDLIDLPFPLRKMSITPMGTLKQEGKIEDKYYTLERGVYSFPSVGDSVILPSDIQLKSIVENKEKNACVKIGVAPIAGNADVKINPDRLFGRHVAILGNTGSGKSCSVAGVIRWSLEEASSRLPRDTKLNTRFIILDPNGEYTDAFNGLNCEIKKFKVEVSEDEVAKALKVPAWLWNSYEWSSFSNASGRTQRPLLKQALRELKTNSIDQTGIIVGRVKRYLLTSLFSLQTDLNNGPSAYSGKPGKNEFGNKIQSFIEGINHYSQQLDEPYKTALTDSSHIIETIRSSRYGGVYNENPWYHDFLVSEVETIINTYSSLLQTHFPESVNSKSNEDDPIPFDVKEMPNYIDSLAEKEGKLQYVDFLTMRIRTLLADNRMKSVVVEDAGVTLENWLESTIGGISIIDLSLVPSDITHLVVSVISRVVFESLQRYRKMTGELLPTVMVMEEAHNFIKRYNDSSEEISASQLCTQSFEKIAREGRKFGLSLTLSSQRPSELSPTVLSQCNTFLLHRIVNDRDQELVRRLVPDNIGGLLQELPILPTRKAILLGWASPLPILVEMRELKKEHRPKSDDPDFWDVWTRNEPREVNWKELSNDWQNINEDEPDN